MVLFLLKKINTNQVFNKYLNKEYDSVTIIKSKNIQDYGLKSDKKVYAHEYTSKLEVGDTIKCNWCSQDYILKKQNIGIPIDGYFLLEEQKFYYKTEGVFCSYECAYALLNVLVCRNPGLYINSENHLKDMFSQDYPGKKLKAANDFWLQKTHGGPLNDKEFVKHHYRQSNNRVIVQVKSEYELC